MKKILSNAFSLNMISTDNAIKILITPINKNNIPVDVESAVGHPDTARVISNELGFTVEPNRVTVRLDKGDILFVAQYIGPRLQEGATTLPENATIKYLKVTIE